MACRNAYRMRKSTPSQAENKIQPLEVPKTAERLLFGMDTKIEAYDLLQNNITLLEWATRNKIQPNFVGRNIVGEHCLTKEEITFLRQKGCKIALIYSDPEEKSTEEQGMILAKKIEMKAIELGISTGPAVFLEIEDRETVTYAFMKGFATALIHAGFTPAFKANTDAKFAFDREFSRGMQTDKDIFKKCLIWAVSPTVKEYNGITTSHLIHPDNWMPYAPSGLTRAEIAIWQYGVECHPIEDDMGKVTTFNLDLVRNEQVIVEKMF